EEQNEMCFCDGCTRRCKEYWTLINPTVCYKSKGNQPGQFAFQQSGTISSLKLQHISGLITCSKGNSKFGSSIWSCSDKLSQLSTVITYQNKTVFYPPNVKMAPIVNNVKFDDRNSFEMRTNELIYKRPSLRVVSNETILQIWNTNDLGGDHYDRDNDGTHCVKVFAKYEYN
uniref:Uncharacterized protein n=2 Tax=Clytia hemisphaerica TaxID=252671 RepID=A0A7M5VF23_9CNID